MINQPILHKQTKSLLDNHLAKPSHALILTGPVGIGKKYVALWIAQQLNTNPLVIAVADDKKMIGIEQIQQLYVQTRSASSLCVVIEDAHLLTKDAQNAFLKLLEEPPSNTFFVLTTKDSQSLLQTIRSRAQSITIYPPDRTSLLSHIQTTQHSIDESALQSLVSSTKGYPGLLLSLITDKDALSAHLETLGQAKKFFTDTPQVRLQTLVEHSFDTTWCRTLIDTISLLLLTLLQVHIGNKSTVAKLNDQIMLIDATAKALQQAGNPKIHMTKLALEL